MEAYDFSRCPSTSVASMLGNHRRLSTQIHGPRAGSGDLRQVQEVITKVTKLGIALQIVDFFKEAKKQFSVDIIVHL